MKRSIESVFTNLPKHWVGDGFHVSNVFPSATDTNKRMSPFFLLDYHAPKHYAPTTSRRGVGTHPHRGFETVTVAYQGAIAHRDSAGNAGIIHPDEVQWMTAGRGVLHNEFHDASFAKTGGPMQMAQIWVNLPKKDKLTSAKYQDLIRDRIPDVVLPNGKGTVRVISGDYAGTAGLASTFSPVHMWDVRLKAGGSVDLPTDRDFNTALLVIAGKVTTNGSQELPEGAVVLYKNNGTVVRVEATSDAALLFLSGAPIEEPLIHYGPFVMNTVEEINQAVEDYNAGRFGVLTD